MQSFVWAWISCLQKNATALTRKFTSLQYLGVMTLTRKLSVSAWPFAWIFVGMSKNPEAAAISIPSMLEKQTAVDRQRWVWRTNLALSQPFWRGWYTGLSDLFLQVKSPKLLMLAGTDRLDKALTIGQMQGKFQLSLLTQVPFPCINVCQFLDWPHSCNQATFHSQLYMCLASSHPKQIDLLGLENIDLLLHCCWGAQLVSCIFCHLDFRIWSTKLWSPGHTPRPVSLLASCIWKFRCCRQDMLFMKMSLKRWQTFWPLS